MKKSLFDYLNGKNNDEAPVLIRFLGYAFLLSLLVRLVVELKSFLEGGG